MGVGWWVAMHLTVLGSGGSGNCALVSTGRADAATGWGLSTWQIGIDCRQLGCLRCRWREPTINGQTVERSRAIPLLLIT
jgi:hypothetical protein